MPNPAKKILKKLFSSSSASASSSRTTREEPPPKPHPPIPEGYLCSVSSLLMKAPRVIDSGQSLEEPCLKACRALKFSPPLHTFPPPNVPLLPNRNLDLAISEWCVTSGHPSPTLISSESALHFARGLKSMPIPPPRPLPFMFSDEQEAMILKNLQEDTESAFDSLVKKGTPLCSPKILAALIYLLQSNHQTLAAEVIYNFSLDANNGAHIIRSGAIPHLIAVIDRGFVNAYIHAAVTLQKLAGDEPYFSLAIGALGAIKPLLDRFCDNSLDEIDRNWAGFALYHLSVNCQVNAEVLAEEGGVLKLMKMAGVETSLRELRKQALMIVNCLVRGHRVGKELMDVGNIEILLKLVSVGEGVGLQSLNVMYNLCRVNFWRFQEVARVAGGEVVLAGEMENLEEKGKEMASVMLRVIRREINEGEELREIKIE